MERERGSGEEGGSVSLLDVIDGAVCGLCLGFLVRGEVGNGY